MSKHYVSFSQRHLTSKCANRHCLVTHTHTHTHTHAQMQLKEELFCIRAQGKNKLTRFTIASVQRSASI